MAERLPFRIEPARTPADLGAVATLFRAYAASLEVDLAFQGFEAETDALPGPYALPTGELLLARDAGGEVVGCVGLRAMPPPGCCEMKRLYVAPHGRGLQLGGRLIDAILAEAARLGYRSMRLDTLPSMSGAIALYGRAGFRPIEPYYETPLVGTVFLGRAIAD